MKFSTKLLLAAVTLGTIASHAFGTDTPGTTTASDEEEVVEAVWFNGDIDAASVSLIYGNRESAEDVTLTLTCTRRSGTVRLFVTETGEKLKPWKTVAVTLTAGSTKMAAKGKTVPNEMAGGTSTQLDLPAEAPIWAAMTEAAGTLGIGVADVNVSAPLKGIGAKAIEFATACQK